jgi:hypothetical protein
MRLEVLILFLGTNRDEKNIYKYVTSSDHQDINKSISLNYNVLKHKSIIIIYSFI